MGMMSFYVTECGKDEREAFNKLVAEATREYGEDEYNGSISTTELVGDPVVIAKDYSAESEDAGYEYAKKNNYGEKWESRCLDLGVTEYVVTTVKKTVIRKRATLVFETRYILEEIRDGVIASVGEPFKTKQEAEDAAIKRAIESGTRVVASRTKVPTKGRDVVSYVDPDVQHYAKLPKDLPEGASVAEIHMYGFYGWAAT